MHTITVKSFVRAPLDRVWASWDDFDNVHRFHPFVSDSRRLGDSHGPPGVGTKRECELADGRNWLRERITDYVPEKVLAVDVYEHSLPLRGLGMTLRFRALGDDRTEVTMTTEFAGRTELLGRLLVPFTRRRLRHAMRALLEANARHVEDAGGARQAA